MKLLDFFIAESQCSYGYCAKHGQCSLQTEYPEERQFALQEKWMRVTGRSAPFEDCITPTIRGVEMFKQLRGDFS